MKTKNLHIGSSLDELLNQEGILPEVEALAMKRVLARELSQAMKEKHLRKAEMARRMHTSRAALDRLLDPENASVTLGTMYRAAAALGKKLHLAIEDIHRN